MLPWPATTPAARLPTARRAAEAHHGGFRAYGKSKDSRDDLPQIVIGMAVTRDGIPVRGCVTDSAGEVDGVRFSLSDLRDGCRCLPVAVAGWYGLVDGFGGGGGWIVSRSCGCWVSGKRWAAPRWPGWKRKPRGSRC